LKPRDTVELILIRHFVYAVWEIERLTRYGTVSIERWSRETLQLQAQQEKLQKARKEDLAWKHAEKNFTKPNPCLHERKAPAGDEEAMVFRRAFPQLTKPQTTLTGIAPINCN